MLKSPKHKKCRVIFFQVKSAQIKLKKLYEIALDHFEKKEPLLIRVDTQEALEFIDNFLWQYPEGSFLPHAIMDESDDFILISSQKGNPNQANHVFNLTKKPLIDSDIHFATIYEFEELHSTEKNHLAQKRYHAYKKVGFAAVTL